MPRALFRLLRVSRPDSTALLVHWQRPSPPLSGCEEVVPTQVRAAHEDGTTAGARRSPEKSRVGENSAAETAD